MEDIFSATEAGNRFDPKEEGKSADLDDDDEKGEDRPSGLLDHIAAATLVSSNKGEPGDHGGDEQKEGDDKESKNKEKPGGGLLDHLISNLVAPLSPKKGDKQVKIDKEEPEKVEEHDQVQSREQGRAGTSILENIVSYFPKSLPDDAAPSSDEASILIHSIIHD